MLADVFEDSTKKSQTIVARREGSMLYLEVDDGDGVKKKITFVDYPEIQQVYDFDCGAASLRTLMSYYGNEIREGEIIEIAKTNSDFGTKVEGLKAVADKVGMKYEMGSLTIQKLKALIASGIPVQVLIQAWSGEDNFEYGFDFNNGHYVVAVGFDEDGKIYFEDPWATSRVWMSEEEFEKRWTAKFQGPNEKEIYHFGFYFPDAVPQFRASSFPHLA
jgi:ABC-type bacteriocin/lantibiotic exporter with double-glycine peptidase domain